MLIRVICNKDELKDEEAIQALFSGFMQELACERFKGSVQIEEGGEKQ